VAPLFAGKVAKLHVVPGDVVHKGELLAEMDSSLLQKEAAVLQSRVELARSQVKLMRAGFRNEEVDDAQAAVDRAQARLTRAQADAAREDQLYQAGVTARASYDAARSELAQAQADLASARAQLDLRHNGNRPEDIGVSEGGLKVAQAELEQVRFNIGQCRITAPTDGMVYELFTSEGGWIDPADGGATHAALLSLFDPQRLQAYADVNQRDSARLSIGQAVELTADAAPQAPFKGMVERLAPQANLQKNTVRAIIRIPEVPTYLKPEMNLKVTFLQPAAAVAPPAPVSTGGTP
jgi:HlyD family secretion protein